MVCNHSIQECKFAIFFWFQGKLDGSFNRVEVAMEGRELVGVESSTCVVGNTH